MPCRLGADTVATCKQGLVKMCQTRPLVEGTGEGHYVKFWRYCVSETDGNEEGGSFYFSGMNDQDNLFSASQSLYEKGDSFGSSNSRPSGLNDEDDEDLDDDLAGHGSTSPSFTGIGKIVGIILVLFLTGMLLVDQWPGRLPEKTQVSRLQ